MSSDAHPSKTGLTDADIVEGKKFMQHAEADAKADIKAGSVSEQDISRYHVRYHYTSTSPSLFPGPPC